MFFSDSLKEYLDDQALDLILTLLARDLKRVLRLPLGYWFEENDSLVKLGKASGPRDEFVAAVK